MIPANEKLIDNAAARKAIQKRTGRRPDLSTIFRWQMTGLRGVRLEHTRCGRSIFTSEQAINRFFNALADAACAQLGVQRVAPTSSRHSAAEAELAAAGL